MRCSAVGLGTWAIGGWRWGGTDEAAAEAAIQASIDEGITLIDTAPAYGLGRSEEIVGRAIAGRRDSVVISTKCGIVWHTDKGVWKGRQDGADLHQYLGPESIAYEVEQSLRRLGTDRIDHYITHWPDATTPVEETMDALLRLKEQGKIRSIGASNLSPPLLRAYLDSGQIDAVQEKYNMIERGLEDALLPLCRDNGVSVLSYSSLALGLLTGKIGPDRTFAGDDLRIDNPLFTPAARQKAADFAADIHPVAEAHGASIAQIVIAWTLTRPGITFALCGARNPSQARDNAGAGRLRLSEADIAAVNSALERHFQEI
ncbi:aldo/keto reductase [Tropicimonas marinistellae]|uniref:aldo/keto reductase n=1 Tax=Tropicimonas marinistellae TaxID=1739787 RepID=UPI001F219F1C|nr:aldo/keto reductase [Tropicimonas marinistellae]